MAVTTGYVQKKSGLSGSNHVLEDAFDADDVTLNTDADVSGNTWVVDEDDMSSDSATKVPTQQSVKAYVDAAGGGGAWDGDITDMDITGGSDIGAALADADLIVVDDGASDTIRKSAISRVWTYILAKITAVTDVSTWGFVVDEDDLTSDLDTKVPTQQSVKAYVDSAVSAPEGTAVLSTGEVGGSKFLREDGDGTCSWQAIGGGGDMLAANNLSDLADDPTARANLGLNSMALFNYSSDFATSAATTIGIAATGITAGAYALPGLTVNAGGRVTAIAEVSAINGVTLGQATPALIKGTDIEATGVFKPDRATLTDAATIAIDMSLANNFSVTLEDNRTMGNPSNTTDDQSGDIFILQDGTGSRTLSWSSNWEFEGGTAPTLSTAANSLDIISYTVYSSTRIVAKHSIKGAS